jgi:hypothetical protein
MLQSLINAFFGCSHRNTTFPQTPTRKSSGYPAPGVPRHATYVTCLDCGKELAYNWEEMRVGKPVSERRPAGEAQPSFLR